MKIIPYGRQYIYKSDIRYVSKSLKGKLITTGEYVKGFLFIIAVIIKKFMSLKELKTLLQEKNIRSDK